MSSKVLVVDDSGTMRKIIIRSLNAVGFADIVEERMRLLRRAPRQFIGLDDRAGGNSLAGEQITRSNKNPDLRPALCKGRCQSADDCSRKSIVYAAGKKDSTSGDFRRRQRLKQRVDHRVP